MPDKVKRILSVHAPSEDKEDEIKDTFYDALWQAYENLPRNDVRMILGDLNAKIGKEESFRPTIRAHSLHRGQQFERNKIG